MSVHHQYQKLVDNMCVLHVSNVGIAWMAYTSSQE